MTQMRSKTEKGPDKKKHGQKIHDEFFTGHSFFNSEDQMQVKYEMLRQAKLEGKSVKETAASFGFSRVAFYQIRNRFEENGLAGLLPQQRGPRGAHKLTNEIMEYVERTLVQDPSLRAQTLVKLVKEHYGISVHRRSIERALVRRQKKLR